MPVHPTLEAFLAQLAQAGAQPENLTVTERRALFETFAPLSGEPEHVAHVENTALAGVGVRIYTPAEKREGTFVFFHGGGWAIGSLDLYDAFCRRIANRAKRRLISVDYRLAPEHKFPAAVEDCYAVLKTVTGPVAVGGDSAGGNLAAAVTLMARDQNGPSISGQVLIYPVTGYLPALPSYACEYLISRKDMEQYWGWYLKDPADARNPLAAPLEASRFDGLPAALIITAEFDPLRDEGEAYADRLKAAGVTVECRRYPGMLHGFLLMPTLVAEAEEAFVQIGHALNRWLWPTAQSA